MRQKRGRTQISWLVFISTRLCRNTRNTVILCAEPLLMQELLPLARRYCDQSCLLAGSFVRSLVCQFVRQTTTLDGKRQAGGRSTSQWRWRLAGVCTLPALVSSFSSGCRNSRYMSQWMSSVNCLLMTEKQRAYSEMPCRLHRGCCYESELPSNTRQQDTRSVRTLQYADSK